MPKAQVNPQDDATIAEPGKTGDSINESVAKFAGHLFPEDQEDREDSEPEVEDDEPETEEPESDEESGDTTETDESDEDEPGEIEEPESTDDEGDLIEVKEDGKPRKITKAEAAKGYMRQADYTRKTQAAAERVRQAEAAEAATSATREQLMARLGDVEEALQSMAPEEPKWEDLKVKLSPEDYAATWADWQRLEKQRGAVKAAKAKLQQDQFEDFQKKRAKILEDERGKFVQALPELSDKAKFETEIKAIVQEARDRGFPDEQIEAIDDHRLLLLVRDAMLYRRLQSEKPKTEKRLKSKVKPARPGAAKTPPKQPKAVDNARSQFAKTGRVKDAAGLIELLSDDE